MRSLTFALKRTTRRTRQVSITCRRTRIGLDTESFAAKIVTRPGHLMFLPTARVRAYVLVICAGLVFSGCCLGAELASPPIDISMFREGEVVRTKRQFSGWSLVCDDIARLHQRYCSLSNEARDADGLVQVALIVSTGDDGRPAALLRISPGVAISSGVLLSFALPSLKKQNSVESVNRRIDFVRCDVDACSAVWALTPKEIVGLNSGAVLRFRFQRVRLTSPFAVHAVTPESSVAIDATMSASGFADAIQESVR